MAQTDDHDEKNNADRPASPSEKEIKDATFGSNFDPLLPEEGGEEVYITTEGGEHPELMWFYPKDRIWGGQIDLWVVISDNDDPFEDPTVILLFEEDDGFDSLWGVWKTTVGGMRESLGVSFPETRLFETENEAKVVMNSLVKGVILEDEEILNEVEEEMEPWSPEDWDSTDSIYD